MGQVSVAIAQRTHYSVPVVQQHVNNGMYASYEMMTSFANFVYFEA